mmetsp:Transcript_32375/g.53595  ORF Transcript_32375/g.53595 Transcript_32375/m.53595 type:complete len:287 (+) Transcript_32375:271-1131(+)
MGGTPGHSMGRMLRWMTSSVSEGMVSSWRWAVSTARRAAIPFFWRRSGIGRACSLKPYRSPTRRCGGATAAATRRMLVLAPTLHSPSAWRVRSQVPNSTPPLHIWHEFTLSYAITSRAILERALPSQATARCGCAAIRLPISCARRATRMSTISRWTWRAPRCQFCALSSRQTHASSRNQRPSPLTLSRLRCRSTAARSQRSSRGTATSGCGRCSVARMTFTPARSFPYLQNNPCRIPRKIVRHFVLPLCLWLTLILLRIRLLNHRLYPDEKQSNRGNLSYRDKSS